MSGQRLPVGVGVMRGQAPPSHLPPIGAKVVRWDGAVGVVQPYEYSREGQRWFPVTFAAVTSMYRTSQLGAEPSSCNGVVRVLDSAVTRMGKRTRGATTSKTSKAELASSA